MKIAGMIVKNLDQFKKDLESEDQRRIKAAQTAVRGEGFRLMRLLKAEIRKAAPGGDTFSPLSEIARAMREKDKRAEQGPLYRLAAPVRYNARREGGNLQFTFGYVDSKGKPISSSWKSLALMHQKGKTLPVTEGQFNAFREMGVKLAKRGDNRAKYFFLKKTTRTMTTPKRPIIEPFWDAHEKEAEQNIISNFARKMAGQRI